MTLGVPSGAPFKLEIQMLINIGDSIINMDNVAEVTFNGVNEDLASISFFGADGIQLNTFQGDKAKIGEFWNELSESCNKHLELP
jgi:hypothetical protein